MRRFYFAAGAFLVCFLTGTALNLLLGFEVSIVAGLVTSAVVAAFVGYTTKATDR